MSNFHGRLLCTKESLSTQEVAISNLQGHLLCTKESLSTQ